MYEFGYIIIHMCMKFMQNPMIFFICLSLQQFSKEYPLALCSVTLGVSCV